MQDAPPIITLTTDFGVSSPYVAEMKGAMLAIQPNLQLIDVSHAIDPQNVFDAARMLTQVATAFPPGTIHVVVVDPGVGTEREILLADSRGQFFMGPNNGVLSLAVKSDSPIYQIDQPRWWRTPVSATFHGRDIMGPVAAYLAGGRQIGELATSYHADWVRLETPAVDVQTASITGQIMAVDSFGNLISNIEQGAFDHWMADVPSSPVGVNHRIDVEFAGRRLPLLRTYGEVPIGQGLTLFGSSGWLEVGVRNGSAAISLPGAVGDQIVVWRDVSPND